MARKNNYFDMFIEMAETSCKTADMLYAILHDFDLQTLPEKLTELHELENYGDIQRHTLMENLAKEFITPIEREDIVDLANCIDDLTDAVEDVLLKVYMYNIQDMPENALIFVEHIKEGCTQVYGMFKEFEQYRKSETIYSYIKEINNIEETCDRLYLDFVREFFVKGTDPIETLAWAEVYACMEECADACEDVAELVETVMLKNS